VLNALHQRLREVTLDDHRAVEQELPFTRPDLDASGLASLLAALLGFFAPLEERLLQRLGEEMPELLGRIRAPALREDLAALGHTAQVPLCGELPELRSRGEATGALYVLEGSLLGGQHIARHLASLGLRARAFETPPHEVAARWRQVMSLLDPHRPDADEVLEGALLTFRSLRRWLERLAAVRTEPRSGEHPCKNVPSYTRG
jgi:heme oxygenase (biliverdin-IX-beta and delta-forming)